MNAIDDHSRSLIAQRAAEWYVAHRGGPLTPAERAQFTAWIKASPQHIHEYLAVVGFSRELGEAARATDADLEDLLRDVAATDSFVTDLADVGGALPAEEAIALDPPKTNKRYRKAYWAAAAALGAVTIGALWLSLNGERWGLPKSYRTAHAEQGTFRLPDGSVMQLNSETHIRVHFSDTERRIDVLTGQAHFQVMRDAARRFRVAAGGASIVALGTEFDVYKRDDATVVTVVEGKVAVQGQTAAPAGTGEERSLELAAGQQARVDARSARAERVQANVRESTAWLQREIAFEQRPLAEVAREFNRYSRIPIEIEDTSLASLRISGVFDAYDTDSFLVFVGRLSDVAVENGTASIRVVTRAGANKPDDASSSRRGR